VHKYIFQTNSNVRSHQSTFQPFVVLTNRSVYEKQFQLKIGAYKANYPGEVSGAIQPPGLLGDFHE
jgi:hypothetical protein